MHKSEVTMTEIFVTRAGVCVQPCMREKRLVHANQIGSIEERRRGSKNVSALQQRQPADVGSRPHVYLARHGLPSEEIAAPLIRSDDPDGGMSLAELNHFGQTIWHDPVVRGDH